MTVAGTALLITIVVATVFGQRTAAEKIVGGVFGMIFFVAGFVAFSVDLRDKPKWAIAPVLREKNRVHDSDVGPAGASVLVAARRRRKHVHRHERDPTPPRREGTSDEWLDPDTKEWLDQHIRETQQ